MEAQGSGEQGQEGGASDVGFSWLWLGPGGRKVSCWEGGGC